MEQRTLGRTGWRVSEIACGTYQTFDVAGRSGRAQVLDLMRANLNAGVNLFDSAPMYGHSEANIGPAVAPLDRDGAGAYFIATKVLQSTLAGAKRQIENSFAVIGGRIDLLQIHNMAGWRDVLPYLAELKAAGRIGATGVTHYDSAAFREIEKAMRTGLADVIQIPYNVMEREVERRLLPLAREMNLGVLVMTPICPLFRRGSLLQRLKGLDLTPYRSFGIGDVGSLCLKWLLSKDPALVLLPASSRLERVASNAAVSGAPPLPPELMHALEWRFG
ncbi:MAG: aldo/keto reductase [SAR324 cluster bacterium]|nr:aldo/keto reductase [SAR324 cluster bacterium]